MVPTSILPIPLWTVTSPQTFRVPEIEASPETNNSMPPAGMVLVVSPTRKKVVAFHWPPVSCRLAILTCSAPALSFIPKLR